MNRSGKLCQRHFSRMRMRSTRLHPGISRGDIRVRSKYVETSTFGPKLHIVHDTALYKTFRSTNFYTVESNAVLFKSISIDFYIDFASNFSPTLTVIISMKYWLSMSYTTNKTYCTHLHFNTTAHKAEICNHLKFDVKFDVKILSIYFDLKIDLSWIEFPSGFN